MATRTKVNEILKSADIETKEFLKTIIKVAIFIGSSKV